VSCASVERKPGRQHPHADGPVPTKRGSAHGYDLAFAPATHAPLRALPPLWPASPHLACCRWRRAIWVSGEGRYASVSLCGHLVGRGWQDTPVQLYRERDDAEAANRAIDATGCGNRCSRNHFTTDLARVALEDREV